MSKEKPKEQVFVGLCEICHRGYNKNSSKKETLLTSILLVFEIFNNADVEISKEHLKRIEKQLGIIECGNSARFGEPIKLQKTGENIMINPEKRVVCGYCESLFWKSWLIHLQDVGKSILENC